MKYIIFICTLILFLSCKEQQNVVQKEAPNWEQLNKHGISDISGLDIKYLEQLEHWNILAQAADSTASSYNSAFILESKDSLFIDRCSESDHMKNIPRILAVANSSNKIISQNNQFVALANEGGMVPYLEPGLYFKNGLLHLEYQFTRSTTTYSFEILKDQVYTAMMRSSGVHAASGDYTSHQVDFISRQVIIEEGNIGEEVNTRLDTIALRQDISPKNLKELTCPYEWEILENVYF